MKKKTKLKSMRSSTTLKWRIVVYLLLFVAIIIAALWVLQSIFLETIYMDIKTKQIKNNALYICRNINAPDFSNKVTLLSLDQKTCIFVYNLTTNDEIISAEGIEGRCELHRIVYRMLIYEYQINQNNIDTLVKHAKENGGDALYNVNSHGVHMDKVEFSTEFKRKDSEQSALAVSLCQNALGQDVVVMLNTVISPMAETVSTLNTMLLYISIILIILAVVFATVISYLVSQPLSKLNDKAKELAKGNYNVNFEGASFSEVNQLADTLNYASSQLSKLNTLKTELIANISHDLRTPITLISGYAEVMRDIPEEMSEENLQIIIDESERMSQLVNQILDFSKLQSGNIQFNMEKILLTECISGELTRYAKLRDHEGYRIEFKYDDKVWVKGDSARLMQALYNLVNNAVCHTGNDNTVTVVQTIKDDRVRISVIDSGDGIPREQLSSIWERYYKVNKKNSKNQTGSGLGLSIVKAIIEAHCGVCGVYSTPGKGSCFWFELDIAK